MIHESFKPRILVILAGWLGSTEKSLRRYKNLYETLGYDVLVKIPTPTMTVMSALYPPTSKKRKTFLTRYTMDDLANDLVGELGRLDHSHFIIHAFSNSGTFLWESVREIMNKSLSSYSVVMNAKLSGIIFDSAPAEFSQNRSLIYSAIDYCELRDRLLLKAFLNIRSHSYNKEISSHQERAKSFWLGMKDCTLPIPQLYIASKDDQLSPFNKLMELVRCREKEMGKRMIHSHVFESSPHCQHMLTNPNMYKNSICEFLVHCFSEDDELRTKILQKTLARNGFTSQL